MKLALIGADEEALQLVRWAVFAGGHQLLAAYDTGPLASEVAAIAADVRLGDDWESLVLGTQADAVIVARGQAGTSEATGISDDERRADQLRKLAQAAVPMLVVCPACESIIGFEIEMIRRESGGVIVPFIPGQGHTAIVEAAHWLSAPDQSPIGPVEQVVFERRQEDRSRGAVLLQFARDVSLLRQLIGTVRGVTAAGPSPRLGRDPLGPKPRELPALANLSATLTGDPDAPARWSIEPAAEGPGGRLTLVGAAAKGVLEMPLDRPWSVAIGNGPPRTCSQCSDYQSALRRLADAIDARSASDAAWLDACRDQEAAEAIDRSLARGRTIELFNEEHTEEESFKGVMAVGGCLLLLGALCVVFVATIVEGLRLPLRDWAVWRYWPVYLLVPIVVFLLLQVLQVAVKKNPPSLRQLVSGDEPIP